MHPHLGRPVLRRRASWRLPAVPTVADGWMSANIGVLRVACLGLLMCLPCPLLLCWLLTSHAERRPRRLTCHPATRPESRDVAQQLRMVHKARPLLAARIDKQEEDWKTCFGPTWTDPRS